MLTNTQVWYRQDYLKSSWWENIKKEVIKRDGYICSMKGCGRRSNLEVHHLSYLYLGTEKEAKFVVILCHTHHFLCHYSLLGKIKLTQRALTKRYKTLKTKAWRRIKPSQILSFL